jgi:hypothetical protein
MKLFQTKKKAHHVINWYAFLLLALTAVACEKQDQNNLESEFLNQTIGRSLASEVLWYSGDTLFFVNKVKWMLEKDTIKEIEGVIVLSDYEKKIIKSNLNCKPIEYWRKRISEGSLRLVNEQNKNIYLIDGGKEVGWCFTKPLFFRNNTLCFFGSFSFSKISFGGAHYTIYEKRKGKWIPKMSLYDIIV